IGVGISVGSSSVVVGWISEDSNSTDSLVSVISSVTSSQISLSLGLEIRFLIFLVLEITSVSIGVGISVGSSSVVVGWISEDSNSTDSFVSVISSVISSPISLSLGLEIRFLIFLVLEITSVSIGVGISVGSSSVGVASISPYSTPFRSLVSVISSVTSSPISLSLGLEIRFLIFLVL